MVLIYADSVQRSSKEEDAKLYCKALTEKITRFADIPEVCKQYPDVLKQMKSRIDERDAAIAFQGMQAGSGNEARAARIKGRLSQPQIQRLHTNTRRFSKKKEKSSFFG
eukprot:CAMPEP_0194145958 /NCGR_PEP_ID=MMETSP0152-20130528/18969_1 /TAXON_ID=1049557 /ORGANISM="Thalassiothrix antarctica, Strain L6-D1" /LENGTH=108 /DNA_ID=CAMNT_0038846341 /DNA_START=38 /DNA_END=364 /DNA_ORIENTATION=+